MVERGKVGDWRLQQEIMQEFSELPSELQQFVCKPINRPYLELAMRLSDLFLSTGCAQLPRAYWKSPIDAMTPSSSSPQDLLKQAQLAYDAENFQSAAQLFLEAADGFRIDNDAVNAAECDNNRSVALLRAGDPSGALKAASGTEQVFAQANDRRRQAMALGNQAAALEEIERVSKGIGTLPTKFRPS